VNFTELQREIEELASTPAGASLPSRARDVVELLLTALERGELRSAERDSGGSWRAVPWVKRGILLGFRAGSVVEMPGFGVTKFFDKDTYPPRSFSTGDGIRIVPGGSSIRRGTYVAPGVVCMPPMYVNVGAYIGKGTMVDSHALVGSCAQIGERVHLSAAAQIGGVLEPINASPVIIEDDVIVGGNCGIYEGTVVRHGAVIGAGVVLTRGTPVYDLVNERVYKGSPQAALEIPPDAVVVPGARQVNAGWGSEQKLSLQTPVIVKYRDDKTDSATALESWLR
jgi:2,3,4,5-tetrahydropyridine-2-carboxylate N-succinyltransferase